jgi:colanic acid/amylovoran biosynthesis protein
LLIPHVAPLNGDGGNNDELFLAEVAAMLPGHGGRLGVVPSGMNACQLKYVIGHCRLFIGARTHATIAALSGGVPTVSIAYSVKARGINHDLFGHENYVLPTARLSVVTLEQSLRRLLREEQAIRQQLSSRMPQWARMGRESAVVFSERLRERGLQNA